MRAIAQGGFDAVWLGAQVLRDRQVGVTVLHCEVLVGEIAVERFPTVARVTPDGSRAIARDALVRRDAGVPGRVDCPHSTVTMHLLDCATPGAGGGPCSAWVGAGPRTGGGTE